MSSPEPEKTTTPASTGSGEESKESSAPKRFICFVGNLPYSASVESITEWFNGKDAGPVHEVRLLTHRPYGAKGPPRPKGCAFVEFTTSGALVKAIKLNHGEFEGRKINIELTAGGGGKGEARRKKIEAKNQALKGERSKAVTALKAKKPILKAAAEKKRLENQAKEALADSSVLENNDVQGGKSGFKKNKKSRENLGGMSADRMARLKAREESFGSRPEPYDKRNREPKVPKNKASQSNLVPLGGRS